MRSTVERSLSMLVHAARSSPPLREAVAEVEDELRRLQDLAGHGHHPILDDEAMAMLTEVLTYHYRKNSSDCGCGWARLGYSHPAHVAEVFRDSLAASRSSPDLPEPPEDRSDLVALGRWVADCLDETNHLVWRTIVRRLVDEIEQMRGCATHGTVDAATLSEHEPRPIPACDCDQEPYQ